MTKKDYEAMLGSKDDLLPEHKTCRTFALEGWTSGGPGGQGVLHWQEIAKIFAGLRHTVRMWSWHLPVYTVERQIISSGRGRKRWEHAITIVILYGIDFMEIRRMEKSEEGRAKLRSHHFWEQGGICGIENSGKCPPKICREPRGHEGDCNLEDI